MVFRVRVGVRVRVLWLWLGLGLGLGLRLGLGLGHSRVLARCENGLPSIVLGGVCRYATAALLIHCV